jgi:hypothetical protein
MAIKRLIGGMVKFRIRLVKAKQWLLGPRGNRCCVPRVQWKVGKGSLNYSEYGSEGTARNGKDEPRR